jgi:hypothetical protein
MAETNGKTKTLGKFTVTSKFDKDFSYTGYSKQCEVAFRDYCNWCGKGKAPKALQAEYDKRKATTEDTDKIFELHIQEMTPEEFVKETGKSLETNRKIKKQETTEQKIERAYILVSDIAASIRANSEIADKELILNNFVQKLTEQVLKQPDAKVPEPTAKTPEKKPEPPTEPKEEQPTTEPEPEPPTHGDKEIYDELKSGTSKKDIYDVYGIDKKELDAIIKKYDR